MTMISRAIASLYPTAEYSIENENYESIRWFANQPNPIPSVEQLEEEALRLEEQDIRNNYQRLRQPEYPPLADLADALYWQSKGNDIKMAAYLAAVDAVKTRYPKGAE
jgi:hypothetical protein